MGGFQVWCILCIFLIYLSSHVVSRKTCGWSHSHYPKFWSWPESSRKVSESDTSSSCSDAFAGNFPTFKIQQCHFTSGFKSLAQKNPRICSDKCLVAIKIFVVEISELDLCYKTLLDELPKGECENDLENQSNLEDISECNFTAIKNVFEFQLPNLEPYHCLEECAIDILLLSGRFSWKRTCYKDWVIVNNTIANIESGLFASGDFELKIPKAAHFQHIIDKVYEMHFVNLTSFIEQLENTSYRQQLLVNLYKKMKTESDTENNTVIILQKLVDDEISRSCNLTKTSMCTSLESLKRDVDLNAESVLNRWAAEVRGNVFGEIIEFGNPPTITPAGYAFNKVLPKLIEKALDGNLANLKNTFVFAKELRWNMHKYEALSTLKSWLAEEEDRLKLLVAFGIKEAIENLNGPDPKEKVETDLELLKNSYSSIVRDVVWNGECRIRNGVYSDYNEYLHEGESEYQFEDGTGNKRVFTWTRPQVPQKSLWRFEKVEVDGEIRFSIKNVDSGWNLCAYTDFKIPLRVWGICSKEETQIEADRRWVSMQTTIGKCDWYVEFDEELRGIYLKNVDWNEYFYASKYKYPKNDEFRYPLLWKPGTIVDSSLWKLEFWE